ncbi:hypothetical protein KUV95_13090 [Microbulbifer agarilyticus]|uniref:hypothetical protein n=1 Tax=Microbulbifer agarilyticus TaxID=260552 RepID=UPI001C96FCA3|nr:hypothetical protein [Microbulbifer agarilyticus]MBY6212487.1 hypothetical protein [Microbulbifer agarilyticus]
MKIFPLCLLIFLCGFSPAMPAMSGIQLKVSDDRVIDVDLAEAKLISELKGYAIIAGRTCVDCDENTAIFLERIDIAPGEPLQKRQRGDELPELERFAAQAPPDSSVAEQRDRSQAEIEGNEDGVLNADLSGERFTYPGVYRDYLTKELVEKTRMFYGKCHEDGPALLWLSEYLTDKGWVKEEYLLVFRDEGIEHRYNQTHQPSVYFISNEGCREVPGVDTTTEP